MRVISGILGLFLAVVAGAAQAQLLSADQDSRVIALQIVDTKPLVPVTVDGLPGIMMFDVGTPEAAFFNRDAAVLAAGVEIARGHAASGQVVTVQRHVAPKFAVAGQGFALDGQIVSGDFGFAEVGYGPEFMGFVGLPAMLPYAFTLDFKRKALTILRVDDKGALRAAPDAADIRAVIAVSMASTKLPTTEAVVGDLTLPMDFDSGDGGTLYLRPETKAAMVAAGTLRQTAAGYVLGGLQFGGASFDDTRVAVIEAGSPADFRGMGAVDLIRIGSVFLGENPSLWNFPAGTITFLDPDSAFLAQP